MKITKTEFMSYERVRKSGKTNMFKIGNVKVLSGLPKSKILFIMKNYNSLGNKYMGGKK